MLMAPKRLPTRYPFLKLEILDEMTNHLSKKIRKKRGININVPFETFGIYVLIGNCLRLHFIRIRRVCLVKILQHIMKLTFVRTVDMCLYVFAYIM